MPDDDDKTETTADAEALRRRIAELEAELSARGLDEEARTLLRETRDALRAAKPDPKEPEEPKEPKEPEEPEEREKKRMENPRVAIWGFYE